MQEEEVYGNKKYVKSTACFDIQGVRGQKG